MNPHDPMIETNDPRLTDYVLGELAPNDIAQIEAALKASPELRAAVADIRAATETIASVFQTEPLLQLSPEQKAELLAEAESANTDVHSLADNVVPKVASEHYRPSSGSTAHWLKIAVAAGLAGLLLGGAYYFTETNRRPMAVSDVPVHDSVAEPKRSESLSESDREDDFDGRKSELEQPTIQQFKTAELKNKEVDSLQDSVHPFATQGISDKSEAKKQASPARQAAQKGAMVTRKADSIGAMRDRARSDVMEGTGRSLGLQPRVDSSKNFYNPAKQPASKNLPNSGSRRNAVSNSPILLRAQQSLDRSPLGSLNLKVVTKNNLNYFSPRKGGSIDDNTNGDQPTEIAKPPVGDDTAIRGAQSPAATFQLQISDQAAKQMVQLLANQADPLQQRKLSFNELIGLQQSQLAEKNVAGNDPEDAPDFKPKNAPPALGDDKDRQKLRRSLSTSQNTAALMLASRLREHLNQRLHQQNKAPADQFFEESDTMKKSSKARNTPSEEPNRKQMPGEAPLPSIAAAEPREELLSSEFNFDYTLVIQRLKSNLEIRNQSMNLPARLSTELESAAPNEAPAKILPQ